MKSLFFFLTFLLPAFSQAQLSVKELSNQAQKATESKDWDKAIGLYKQLDSLRPYNAIVHTQLAYCYLQTKDTATCFAKLNVLLRFDAYALSAYESLFEGITNHTDYQTLLAKAKELQTEITDASLFFTIDERDLHAESIAYHKASKRVFIGSVHKRKIMQYDVEKKTLSAFAAKGQDQLQAVMGMKVDDKRQLLWVCTSSFPEMQDFDPKNLKHGLLCYDLNTNQLKASYWLKEDGKKHAFGDLCLHPKTGMPYISDSFAPTLYTLENENIVPFFTSASFENLQGLSWDTKGEKLFVSDYRWGLFYITSKKELGKLDCQNIFIAKGIDGLYFYQNNLILVQNGVNPFRISKVHLSKDMKKVISAYTLENNTKEMGEPTQLCFIGKNEILYIANSQWAGYGKDGKPLPWEELKPIYIFHKKLK